MTFEIILLVISLFLSGFFSASETALFTISRVKALHMAKDGSGSGRLILRMKKDSHRLLTTILIGNNLVNIGASSIATSLAISQFQSNAVGIATGVMTLLILVFGEIFPKSFANQNNIFIARIVIYPLYWFSRLFFPLIFILNVIPMLHGKKDPRHGAVTEDELMTMVEVVEEEGEINEAEKQFITKIFEFDDTSCSEIMTPRADMFVIDISENVDISKILQTGFSRIPVIEDSIDNVIGILHVKDLFASFQKACTSNFETSLDIKPILKKPYFIPESKKLDSLLQDFKRNKNHLAVVVDEHGGVAGIVSLEDVLEEIVGEIIDETDRMTPDIIRLKDNKWLIAGRINIYDLNEEIDIGIPESNTYDTFSGFFLEQIGRIPQPGESIVVDKWTATVKDMDGNRIQSFILKKEPS
ncbi:MAG: hemolysin family protein [Desulfobacula sp.]|jgi:CBS domain containing-hemolysin-like protein|nr:hemolysin family protein [Desulfobacula sp.]